MWPFSETGVAFTTKDIPSLQGKVIVITGGNSGLGKQSALELARREPKEIWLTARTTEKAENAIKDIKNALPSTNSANIQPLALDLASFDSIKAAARSFINSPSSSQRLDILMLNAGCMATPDGLTTDGYELQFGTNYLGHALFVKCLTPVLEKTAGEPNSDVRVVVLSSRAVSMAPNGGIHFESLKTKQESMSTYARYGQSKVANALHARELARQYPQWTVTAVHPGVINTNLTHHVQEQIWWSVPIMKIANLFITTVEAGVRNQLWAATAPKKDIKTGKLYFPVGDLTSGPRGEYSTDDELAKRLWEWTEEELKEQMI